MVSAAYIHIPFCSHKCDFCDFAAFAGVDHLTDDYEQVVLREIDDRIDLMIKDGRNFDDVALDSVFFGGGTPGLVSPKVLQSMLEKLSSRVRFAPDCEITIETTPHAITQEKMDAWKEMGINRISCGVESFLDEELKAMGRDHRSHEAYEGLAIACGSGVASVGLDLMYGLPTQTLASFEKSLACATGLTEQYSNLLHLSAYGLHLAENSPLYSRFPKGAAAYPPENLFVEMFELLVESFEGAGFKHYEVSNFAKPGFQSKHNMAYWENKEYLAFGVSAHRYVGGVRSSNWRSLKRYMRDWMADETSEIVDQTTRMKEAIMLGLRLRSGIDTAAFNKEHGFDIVQRYEKEIEKFADSGYIELVDGRLALTRKGVPVSNSIISEFF